MNAVFALGALVTALTLSGCVVAPVAPRPYGYYSEPVMVAPPPPRVEYVGPPPVVGQVWIGGFWNWTGHRHEWVPGRWESPHPGQSWVPHRWERDGDRWHLQGGHWEGGHGGRDHHNYREHDHDRRDWR